MFLSDVMILGTTIWFKCNTFLTNTKSVVLLISLLYYCDVSATRIFRTLSLAKWNISKWTDILDQTQSRSQYFLCLLAIWIFFSCIKQSIGFFTLRGQGCLFIRLLNVLSYRSTNWSRSFRGSNTNWVNFRYKERHLFQSAYNSSMKQMWPERIVRQHGRHSHTNKIITFTSIWPYLWVHHCTCWMRLADLSISDRHLVSVS